MAVLSSGCNLKPGTFIDHVRINAPVGSSVQESFKGFNMLSDGVV